jgi:hypothetical protein
MRTLVPILILAARLAMPADKTNPQVAALRGKSIFVEGNNQAAQKIRSFISDDKKTCFVLAPKQADADATLAVSDEPLSRASHRVSGTLTLKSGDLVWSATDLGPLVSSSAAKLVFMKMQRAAECK